MSSDIEIARQAKPKPIGKIAEKCGIPENSLHTFGRHKAKVDLDYLDRLSDNPGTKLILVTGITPTPAGEGKTTTTVGLGDALNKIGKKALSAIRKGFSGGNSSDMRAISDLVVTSFSESYADANGESDNNTYISSSSFENKNDDDTIIGISDFGKFCTILDFECDKSFEEDYKSLGEEIVREQQRRSELNEKLTAQNKVIDNSAQNQIFWVINSKSKIFSN